MDFINDCLADHHLNPQSIPLLMNCINKASSSVLVNGRKTEDFQHSRGLRQGEPKSPFIFNICLEYLSIIISQACMENLWTPFWGGKDKLPISHLLFADDLFIFGMVDETTTFTLRDILESLFLMSGQKINEGTSDFLS